MRIDPRWLLLLGLAAAPAAAQPTPSLTVTLTPPESLAVDDRAEVIATVAISPRNDGPILITPVSEGASVEVVRGRLSRPDADDPAANPLRFRIPIVARTPGTAVLRVHALGYACNARTKRCRSLETSTSAVLRVVAR
jgi:hypothetical protein